MRGEGHRLGEARPPACMPHTRRKQTKGGPTHQEEEGGLDQLVLGHQPRRHLPLGQLAHQVAAGPVQLLLDLHLRAPDPEWVAQASLLPNEPNE